MRDREFLRVLQKPLSKTLTRHDDLAAAAGEDFRLGPQGNKGTDGGERRCPFTEGKSFQTPLKFKS